MSSSTYLLAGQVSELERLQLQSRVWEPSGRRLLEEIGDGRGARAVDIGCGVMGWLRLLSEWVGPDGEVVGTDIDDAMLAAAEQFVADEGLGNVVLRNDDLFATSLEPASFDLVHARFVLTPLGRGHEQMETYVRAAPPRRHRRPGGPRLGVLALQSSGAGVRAADRPHLRGVRTLGRRRGRRASTSSSCAASASRATCGPRSWRSRRDIPTCGCRSSSASAWNRGCCRSWTPRSCAGSARTPRTSFKNPAAGAPRSR